MIKVFNTQSKKKEDFKPLIEGEIKMYLCGPTVYDIAHLGHGRSAVSFDIIRRYFIYSGYKMTFVSNYTDIDDKMINRAKEEGITVPELADKIIPEYEADYGALGIMPADIQPKATEHIDDMIAIIKKLEEKGCIYLLDDGVYFDTSKFPGYGKLSGQNLEDLQMGARVAVKESKKNPHDFVLWKAKKEGEPFWVSPWGDGRPGWHIECSAMSFAHLGETFDLHGGGLDLTFPHHECEVAQSEAAFGEDTFSKYWIHNGFINVDNEKMSKSLGNFFTLKDIFEKYDPKIVRYMILQTHYRNPISFSDSLLDNAKAGLSRLHDFIRNLKNINSEGELNEETKRLVQDSQDKFENSMDDDFDTSGAMGAVFELVKSVNIMHSKDSLSKSDVEHVFEYLEKIDKVLAVIFFKEENIDADIEKLIKEREEARENKNFAKADEIRDELLAKGIVLDDTSGGTVWKKA
jgi:cysteinyl-tRNA synthetase